MGWRSRRSEPEHADRESAADGPRPGDVRMTAFVHGYVQGVGFRWYTRGRAMELGLVGSATNLVDGRVEVVVEGPREACEQMLGWLRGGKTPGTVDQVVEQFAPARGTFRRFDVG